jgi:hypothetical protein
VRARARPIRDAPGRAACGVVMGRDTASATPRGAGGPRAAVAITAARPWTGCSLGTPSCAHAKTSWKKPDEPCPNQRRNKACLDQQSSDFTVSSSSSKKESTDLETMLHDPIRTFSMHQTAEIYNGTGGLFWISV